MEAPSKSSFYFGDNLTPDAYELIALRQISFALRDRESGLFAKKWFDCRHMAPAQATYLFAHEYQQAVRRLYASTRDVVTAAEKRAFEPDDIFKSSEATAMWRARQAFDALGCRYAWGLDFALKRSIDRGWHYFPRPNQLYAQDLLLDLRDAWVKHCVDIFEPVKGERFRIENFHDHPDQVALQTWLADQVKRRPRPQMLLSRLFKERLLSEALALKVFGEEVVQQAKRFPV